MKKSKRKNEKKKGLVVLIQGAFEILNYGHVRAFRRLKQIAGPNGIVIVALNTNPLLWRYKRRKAILPWQHKKVILEGIRWVDKVIPAPNFSPLALLKKHKVDMYALTREWEHTKAVEIAYMKSKGGRVFFSRRYNGVVPTSEIKRRLLKEAKAKR